MTDADPCGETPHFVATRAEALDRLAAFLPRAGRAYAQDRNTDGGPDRDRSVSALSPYLRYRLLTEREVIAAALDRHGAEAADKFVSEVLWRTYFKGWLELHPAAWDRFLAERDAARQAMGRSGGLARAVAAAEEGRTGIAGFDDWARELAAFGYLHNHARMWFASIWIFTLRLPWTLGADFFLRHLVDADPASNTLSWRWVAGLQTPGKTYLATADNIARHTGGRFSPTGPRPGGAGARGGAPARPPLAAAAAEVPPGPALLLLHPEDFGPDSVVPGGVSVAGVAVAERGSGNWPWGDAARDFVAAAAADAVDPGRAGFRLHRDRDAWARRRRRCWRPPPRRAPAGWWPPRRRSGRWPTPRRRCPARSPRRACPWCGCGDPGTRPCGRSPPRGSSPSASAAGPCWRRTG